LPSGNDIKAKYNTRDVLRSANVLKFGLEYSLAGNLKGSDPRYEIYALMDYTVPLQFDAACGVILVTMVIFILVSFSASFQTEVEVLVVAPLEKMLTTLRSSATVMLKSMNAIEKETKDGTKAAGDDSDDDDGEMETLMLEKMVDKLTRIIKLTYPGANDLDVGEGVDSKTATWLHETYSTNKKKNFDDFFSLHEDEEEIIIEDHDPMYAVEERRLAVIKRKFCESYKFGDTLTGWAYDPLACTCCYCCCCCCCCYCYYCYCCYYSRCLLFQLLVLVLVNAFLNSNFV
jgi:hypothetical protein